MQNLVREWIEKAEGDFATAQREWRARRNRNQDAVCFHAKQCIEKYLKALLQKDKAPFTKTHDLAILGKACAAKHPLLAPRIADLDALSRFAVLFRYPGESAARQDAATAVRLMKAYRLSLRQELGLNN